MTDVYDKPFLVNVEGPDDIEEFDTMREAVERANEINAGLVDTVSRGGEHAPHVWAVPWRTTAYLAAFPNGINVGEVTDAKVKAARDAFWAAPPRLSTLDSMRVALEAAAAVTDG